ncbi:MAG TPA: hypothetical protein VHJ76_07795 [Actinomycetota bacterium]|nr:hypothetical protein [Actinomycetota bacterium]
MTRKTSRHRVVGPLLALVLIAGAAPPARAALWTGACALRVTLHFRSPVRPPISGPNYDIEATGAADVDLTKSGIQPCTTTLTSSPTTGTGAGGSGSAIAWSCAATVATGSWFQTFDAEGPDGFIADHTLTGSWGAWTLHVQTPTPNVVGVGEFTLQAAEATKTPSCATGVLNSVTMVGTLVFQDP